MTIPEPLERLAFETSRLMEEHPPRIRDENKQVVFDIACPRDSSCGGEIGYSRWPAFQLPERVSPAAILDGRMEGKAGIFDYEPVADMPGAIEWHVNFADPRLFAGYGTSLFAQDEMQAAEHPALGALVEALRDGGHPAVTETADGPTPVLVTGVERRCHVATDKNAEAGRPRGLYGNEFALAPADAVRAATRRIEPPTITNFIAMAAPAYGFGPYTRETIEHVLQTAYTGFAAAVAESARVAGPDTPVVIHTGFWGCGAFGGDRVLMTVLQLVAAGMTDVDRLVFHTAKKRGGPPFAEAVAIVRDELGAAGEVDSARLLDHILAMGFEWGMSDGH
jgi:hypothetical protein